MKYTSLFLLLAALLSPAGTKELVRLPNNQNRQTKVTVKAPEKPPLNTLVKYEIIIQGENFPPEKRSRLGQISDFYMVMALDRNGIQIGHIEREEWSRKEQKFVPIVEDGKLKRIIVKEFGEYIAGKIGLELTDDEENRRRRLTETKLLLEDRFEDKKKYKHPSIMVDTNFGQDTHKDAIKITIPLIFTEEISNIPISITYDARRKGLFSTADSKTLEVRIDDIVNFNPNEIIVDLAEGISMSMVYIKPGEYDLFSIKYGKKTIDKVKTKGFYIAKFETTQEQYRAITGNNPSGIKVDNFPVYNVGWNEAVEFCDTTSMQTGQNFRLPTKDEWQIACNGNSLTVYSFGNDHKKLSKHAWYKKNTNQPQPVGLKLPNSQGAHDIHGNVAEWCIDKFENGEGYIITKTNSKDKRFFINHVIMGGNCYDIDFSCRSYISSAPAVNEKGNLVPNTYVGIRPILVP